MEYLILELRKAFVREIKIVFCCLIVYRLALHQIIATDEKHLKIVYRDLGLSADRKSGKMCIRDRIRPRYFGIQILSRRV